jgi:hypothetical protein
MQLDIMIESQPYYMLDDLHEAVKTVECNKSTDNILLSVTVLHHA